MIEKPSKFVFDTNVVVSGCIRPGSSSQRAIALAFQSGTVLVSRATVREVQAVLRRAKFDRHRDPKERLKYMSSFLDAVEMVEAAEQVDVCRDAKDNMFLELAHSGKADLIISGDKDLLCLHPWRGVAILSPADYLGLT